MTMNDLLHVPTSNNLSESNGFDFDLLLTAEPTDHHHELQDDHDFLSSLLNHTDTNFLNDILQQQTSPTGSSLLTSGPSPDSVHNGCWLQSSPPSSTSDDGSMMHSPHYDQFTNPNDIIQLNSNGGGLYGQDVHIDVELDSELCISNSVSVINSVSHEERELLIREGIILPIDLPLTKSEEKHVKRIRRKLKNKQSASDSRKRKKEYVDGLEKRVEKCTTMNNNLLKKVKVLESENRSLVEQLKRLQTFVAQYNPSKAQAGSFMMIVILSFSLLFVPQFYKTHNSSALRSHSRSLLDVSSDDFGNILQDNTFVSINDKDKTPILPLPWKYQSPAVKHFNFSSTSDP